jgi:hypothetical protein
MYGIRKLTVGLALAASLSTAAVGLADAASAAPVQPAAHAAKLAPVKNYRTWEAAQKAAGFPLLMPTKTFGLKLRRGIYVIGCPRIQIPPPAGKPTGQVHATRQVLAIYGGRGRLLPLISFSQRRGHRGPCGMPPFPRQVKIVAKVRVDGVWAILSRAHGSLCSVSPNKKPKCRTIVIWQLAWAKHGHRYLVSSPTKSGRVRVIGFARSLVPVS